MKMSNCRPRDVLDWPYLYTCHAAIKGRTRSLRHGTKASSTSWDPICRKRRTTSSYPADRDGPRRLIISCYTSK